MFENLHVVLGQDIAKTADNVAAAGDKAAEGATQGAKMISGWAKHLTDNDLLNKAIEYGASVIGALLLLIIGLIVAKLISKAAVRAAKRGLHDDGTSPLPGFIGSGVYWGIVVIIVLACLSIFGIETTSFAAILAAAGLAIGLAFQGTLSNLAAGVMLVVFRPFKLGDFITAAGQTGTVSAIKLFTTTIVTLDNRVITIPNSVVSGATIDNCTQEYRRADVDIAVPYASDLASVRAALERAMDVEGAILEDDKGHKSFVYLLSVTPGGTTNYQVRVWCKGDDYWAVRERVTAQCKIEIDRNGVTISSKNIRRADVDVSVAYEADLDATRRALEEALKVDGVLGDPAPAVVLIDLGTSAVHYQLRAWCEGDKYWGVKEALTINAKRQLDKAGIEIPFPQIMVSNKKK